MKRGVTLIELLVVIAVIAVLATLSLTSLRSARESGMTIVCASNVRQLANANALYANDHNDRLAPGAADFLRNLHRWHGTRSNPSEAFTPEGGAMTPYLADSASAGIRACPSFKPDRDANAGFEVSNGGYGYNNAFAGVVRSKRPSGYRIVRDDVGSQQTSFFDPSATMLFADAAFAGGFRGNELIEYSFIEPRLRPDRPRFRPDPSMHFRHARVRANIAWLDTHVDDQGLTFTWSSGLYPGDPADVDIGWTGEQDDNSLYDYR